MKKTRILYTAVVFAALFSGFFGFTGCQKKSVAEAKSDFPKSIVSLSPAATEILFAVGAENQISAVSDYSDYPEQVQNLPKVGGFDGKTLSFEKILSFKPDFVYLTNGMHNFLIEPLEQNGIKYYLSDAPKISDIFDEMLEIGKITGNQKTSEKVVKNLQNELDSLKKSQDVARKSVYYEVWNEPFMSCGSSSFINDVIVSAGGENIFAEIEDAYPIVSEETIIAKNPQVILLPQSSGLSVETVKARNGWNNIDAVKNNQIFVVDDNLMSRPGPRIVEAVKQLSEILSDKI